MKPFTVIILCAGLSSGGSIAAAEEAGQHHHHGMNASSQPAPSEAIDSAASKHEDSPQVVHGPWSYLSRDNPKPHEESRWEMLPVPEFPARYEAASTLSVEVSCQRLLGNPRIMVDRATRARCGESVRQMNLPHDEHADHFER